uniref:Anaphase-promoting complex subunit 4 WD40 domain-containing protein n=1 Tax=Tetraselmis sp. GSL018 TaxID=582737 RepID=A0A061R012_9CHLO
MAPLNTAAEDGYRSLACFSPDGAELAVVAADGRIRTFDVASCRLKAKW